jgi:transposase
MEDWVKNWVKGRREQGEKCIEIKQSGNGYYVYRSTTFWDKQLKKRRKKTSYVGVLDRDKGLVPARRDLDSLSRVSVRELGNSLLLDWALQDLVGPLEDAFGELWHSVYALAQARTMGYTPLKSVRREWTRLYNVRGLDPDLSPSRLGSLLQFIGENRRAQESVFASIADGSELVYDLSTVFTRSENISIAEKGYNKGHLYIPQVNIALFCSVDVGLPTRVRVIPGSVRDAKSLYTSLEEDCPGDCTLILDRGFSSLETIRFLSEKRVKYVLPAKRNSLLYKEKTVLDGHFFYHKRLVKTAKKKLDLFNVYVFEDQDLLLEETKTLYERLDKGLDKKRFGEGLGKAGRIIIMSNVDASCEHLYRLYKSRDRIEKMFDTYKTVLEADKLYLQDTMSVNGHVFLGFLCLYAYTKIELLLKKHGLDDKYTAMDMLQEYSKVYMLQHEKGNVQTEITKTVETLDQKTRLNLFPKT